MRGYEVKQLAEMTGVGPDVIRRMEAGVFSVDVVDLLNLVGALETGRRLAGRPRAE